MGAQIYNRSLAELVAVSKPDIVMAFNGEFLMPETVASVKQLGVKFIIFQADNPLPQHYNSRPETLLSARECDLYLIWSEALVGALKDLGIPAAFLPFGWDDAVIPFQGSSRTWDYDVSFIGGWDRKREDFLVEVARHFDLKIWGPPYWGERTRKTGLARRCWQGRALRGNEVARAMSRSRVNLNILRDQHYIDGKASGVIMRTFEVPGAGGFLLTTRTGEAARLFPEGETVGYYDGVSDCLKKLDFYLTNQQICQKAAIDAHALVDEHHRYTQRVADILSLI